MSLFSLNVFGGFQLSTQEHSQINISAKKAKALLTYLALHPNQNQQRESIATLLWEDCGSTQARHSLRQTMSDLRKAIPDAEQLIDSNQQSLQLRKEFISVDTLNFDNLCRLNDKASLQQAIDLYKGELLEGLYTRSQNFDDWLETERSHKREKALQVMDVLLEQAQSEGELEQAIRLGIKMTALDPLRESAHRILMKTYHKQGRRGSALKQYRLCQQLLRNELGIVPDDETQAIYQTIFQQQQPSPNKQITPLSVADNQHENVEIKETSSSERVNQLRQVTLLSVQFHTSDAVHDPEFQFHRHQQIVQSLKKHISQYHATTMEMQNGSLLIIFGLPSARTNDTEMAVRAAFAILNSLDNQEQAVQACTIKIGISSGQIYIVDYNPDDLQLQSLSGAIIKQTISVADQAQPGQILISDRAFTTITQLVIADEFAVKDSIDLPPIWNLIEITGDHKQQPTTQMVGRKFELQQFLTAARNCKETEYGQLILVRGEPGIGKTRLLKEWIILANDSDFNSHSVSVFDFCTAIGQTPAQTLTRSLLHLQPDSEPAQIKTCVLKSVADNLLSNEQVNFVFDLLNAPDLLLKPEIYQAMDNESRQSGKQEVITTLVQRLSARQPLLIIMEDIHWAEPVLLTLLGQLAADIKDYPIILVFSTRFEGEPLDPLWRSQIQSTSLLTLDISPLRQNEAELLVKQTLDLVADKTAELIQRSGCNPLFLEQLLFCIEQAVDVIPDSVQSIIAAKLDTLDSFDKRAVFVASILGQRFSLEALKYILNDPDYQCSELVVRGLIKPDGSQFLFHHALIMDGIYTIQLPSQRRSLHLLAADWYNDKDSLLYAKHLDKAESEHAASAYLKTAKHLMQLYQYDDAEKMACRGREIATKAEDLFDLSICHADCLRELGQTQASLEAFIIAEQQAKSPKQQCRALIGQGFALRMLDRQEEVLSLIKTTKPKAESLKDTEVLATLHYLHGSACFHLGDLDNCLIAHQQAEAIAAHHKLHLIQARALSGIADAYYGMGHMITAKQKYYRCVALCKQHDFISDMAVNQVMIGAILGFLNRHFNAEHILLETLELTRKVRNRRAEAMALSELGYVYSQKNEQEPARLYTAQSLQLANQISSKFLQCNALLCLSIVDKNEAVLEQAYVIASTNPFGQYYIASWMLAVQAWITNDPNKRKWALQEGEKLLSKQALSHNHLMFYRYAIETCLDTKDFDKAEHFITALKEYTAAEPLPWSEFIMQRAKALIRIGQGETGVILEHNLQKLITQADQAGFIEAKASLLTALQQLHLAG